MNTHRHVWKVEAVHAERVTLRCECEARHSITRGQYEDLVRFLGPPGTKIEHAVTVDENGCRVITAGVSEGVRLRDGIG